MKNILVTCLFVLLFSTLAFASFAYFPIEKRVNDNNLIVIGTLQNVVETETDELEINNGTLVIESIIYGNFANSGNEKLEKDSLIAVEWSNSKMFACTFGFSANKKQIWFLNVDNEGKIESLGPNTSSDLSELNEVKKYVKNKTASKSVKLVNILNKNSNVEKPKMLICGFDSERHTHNEVSVLMAFLVFMISCSMHYFLYRSRFKIR